MNNLLSLLQLGNADNFTIVSVILGGLGIFLFGINIMSSSLNALAGSKLKTIVSKATNNIFKGFLIGFLITVLIQSSSATTVIVVGLISAGLLDLKHAIPIMIGSHIGTTALAFIISIDIISNICLPLIFIGAFIILLISSRKWELGGRIIVGLGFIFLGLELMSISFGSFASTTWFNDLLIALSNNLFVSFITGMLLTALIQSSGAFIGIVQELYITTGSMALSSALALVIGSNIGTTITAIIASIGSSREAKQAAISNTLIAFLGAVIVFPLFIPIRELFVLIETNLFTGVRKKVLIAFFHTFYNIIGAIFSLLLYNYIIIFVNKIFKENKKDSILAEHLNDELLKTSALALESAKVAMIEMNDITLNMYDLAINYFNENNKKFKDEIIEKEEKVDLAEHLIHDYLMKISQAHLIKTDSYIQTEYLDIIRDFERIADHAVNFSEFLERYYDENNIMSNEMHEALLKFFNIVRDQINESVIAFKNNDKKLAASVIEREHLVNKLEVEYRLNVHSYLKAGEVSQLDILYIDIVSNLERISDHTTNICQMIIDPHMMSTMITGDKIIN